MSEHTYFSAALRSRPNQRKKPSNVLILRLLPTHSRRLQCASIWYTSVKYLCPLCQAISSIPMAWTKSSTAPEPLTAERTFRVTHPFHPLHGQRFELLDQRRCWGEDRVIYLDDRDTVQSMPRSWTGVAMADAFVVVSAGRAAFRVTDLLRLADLVGQQLAHGQRGGGEEDGSCG